MNQVAGAHDAVTLRTDQADVAMVCTVESGGPIRVKG